MTTVFIYFYLLSQGLSINHKELFDTSQIIVNQSYSYSIDPILTAIIIIEESGLNPMAISHHGAIGLMQIHSHSRDSVLLWNKENNIREGLRRLTLFKRSHKHEWIAAYNCGMKIKPKCLKYQQRILRKYYKTIFLSGKSSAV